MDMKEKEQKEKKAYNDYVEHVTPKHSLPINMAKAFLVGGIICTIGQGIWDFFNNMGLQEDICGSWTSLILIFISVLLTGLNLFGCIAKFGGAGVLVPITGFANSVAAPAIEYKKEGQVFGIGCKIFTIAGPVILYGLLVSWIAGFIYWLLKVIGIIS